VIPGDITLNTDREAVGLAVTNAGARRMFGFRAEVSGPL
jgi:hypothetical protein